MRRLFSVFRDPLPAMARVTGLVSVSVDVGLLACLKGRPCVSMGFSLAGGSQGLTNRAWSGVV